MFSRRKFLSNGSRGIFGLALGSVLNSACQTVDARQRKSAEESGPVILSTWDHGIPANEAAWSVLANGGKSVDAVEQGVRVPEGDPKISSVGYGGFPDRDGKVTLDACIMDAEGNAGGVCFLEHIKHPISVARLVMDKTPHVLLAGQGALRFALENGFEKEDLLTENAEKAWKKWKKTSAYKPVINIENHDTIGMVALDAEGDLAGACTTSGLAYKIHGRVGDSPIIGAGLYVDNEVGAAVATGLGEEVMKTLGSFLIVELMRQGKSPQEACEEAISRIAAKRKKRVEEIQIGYLALNRMGQTGAFGLHPGFSYALYKGGENQLFPAEALY